MKFNKRITQITIVPQGEPIFSETATVVSLEDEAAGEYITLKQFRDIGSAEIWISNEDWPVIRDAVNQLLKGTT